MENECKYCISKLDEIHKLRKRNKTLEKLVLQSIELITYLLSVFKPKSTKYDTEIRNIKNQLIP